MFQCKNVRSLTAALTAAIVLGTRGACAQVSHGFVRHAWERTPPLLLPYLKQKHIEFVGISEDDSKKQNLITTQPNRVRFYI